MAVSATPAANPIPDDAFVSAMVPLGPFEASPLLAVAVSGGPDSMALLWLADRWARTKGGSAFAVLINHRLRPESAREVAVAAAQIRASGIPAHIRCVAGEPPKNGVPVWARDARYALLEQAATEQGALHLLLAHHQDDQAETVLLRLTRGSGVKGLAGMRSVYPGANIRLLRPLLCFSKAHVMATAGASGWDIADDPSNQDPKYARTRVRSALQAVSGDGARLAETATNLAADDAAIERAVTSLAIRAVSVAPHGVIQMDRTLVRDAPRTVSARLLDRAVRMAGGAGGPIRRTRIDRLLQDICTDVDTRRTCGGAIIQSKGPKTLLWRELGKLPKPTPTQGLPRDLWDNRFRLNPEDVWLKEDPNLFIGPLGYNGLRGLEAIATEGPKTLIGCAFTDCPPRQVIAGWPAIWRGDHIAGISTFGSVAADDGPNAKFCDIKLFHVRFSPPTALTVANAC